MHKSQLDQLILMVNQIVTNNQFNDDVEKSAAATLTHIQKFWARPMKQQIRDYAETDGSALLPAGKLAVERLASQ